MQEKEREKILSVPAYRSLHLQLHALTVLVFSCSSTIRYQAGRQVALS